MTWAFPLLIVVVRVMVMVARRHQRKAARPRPIGLHQPLTFFSFVWFCEVVIALVWTLVALGSDAPWWELMSTAAAFVIGVVPWTWVKLFVIPLGKPRLAYFLARPPDYRFLRDGTGRQVLAAAWALLYARGGATPEQIEWVEQKLAEPRELRPTELLARAFVAAAKGDWTSAKLLAHGVKAFNPRVRPPVVWFTALTFLTARAAEEGDWAAVSNMGDNGPLWAPSLWLLRDAGGRMLGKKVKGASVWLHWAFGSRRLRTLPFARATSKLSVPERSQPVAPASTGDAPERRMAESVVALRRTADAITPEGLVSLAGACEAALTQPDAVAQFLQRAAALGATSADAALGTLRNAARLEVSALAAEGQVRLSALEQANGLIAAASWDERNRAFEALQDALRALEPKSNDPAKVAFIHLEWQEWMRFLERYRAVAELGPSAQQSAFLECHDTVCNYGAVLFNKLDERPFANAIFRFLLAEAELAGHQRAIELQQRNVKAGC